MYYFIINPHSRTGQGKLVWLQLEQILKNKRISYEPHFTEYVGHAKKLARQLSDTPSPRTIIALGGDGTVNEVLDGLILSDAITFGFIPTGSGNDFARGMGLPTDPKKALECILKKERLVSMDVGEVTADFKTHRFGVSTGIGYDASICHEALASPLKTLFNKLKLGKLTYVIIGLKQLLLCHPTPLTIYLDGGRRYRYDKAYFAAVMNLPYEGGGMKFCPDARTGDRVMDICIAAGLPKWKVVCLIPFAVFGLHTHFRGIHILRCRQALIQSAVPLPVHRDGESNGFRTELKINFAKNALKVITPMI
ncbi:MAG: diacylglycerol/lipid kinase family protein [Blautia sp.]|jgi:YegS/Rv2252/BmrU family lipid kinase